MDSLVEFDWDEVYTLGKYFNNTSGMKKTSGANQRSFRFSLSEFRLELITLKRSC
jgi:hypothetical protein